MGDDDGFSDHDEDGFSNCEEAAAATDPNAVGSTSLSTPAIAPTPTEATANDADGDWYGDARERASFTNPDYADSDRDGLADGYETLIPNRFTDTSLAIPAFVDGLVVDWADSDGDGILDGADDADGGILDGADDADGDGYSNAVEAAAATDATSPHSHPGVEADEVVPTPIPTAVDTDGDGYRDARDQFMTSPTNPDSDRDGLSDGFEQLTRGVSSYRADSGCDRVLDGDEDADGGGVERKRRC